MKILKNLFRKHPEKHSPDEINRNDLQVKKEELKKKFDHLKTLMEVSQGYSKYYEYDEEMEKTIKELRELMIEGKIQEEKRLAERN